MDKRDTQRFNFTKKTVESLPIPTERRTSYYDTQTRGLGLLIQPTGHRSFFWFRKVQDRPVWKTLGDFPDLSVEQARDAAGDQNSKLAKWKASDYQGENPFVERQDLTLSQLADDYIERQVRAHAAHPERAVKDVQGMVDTYLTRWKTRRVGSIRRSDVLDLHAELGKENGHVTANRVVQFLRTLYNWAASAELWHGENPARGIKMFHEERRTRFLQPDELARLFRALRKQKNADLTDFVLLALFTGARRGDIYSMRWENVYLDDNRWEVPKPKNRKPYLVPLIPEAVELLQKRLKRRIDNNPWVFPSPQNAEKHLVNLKKYWAKLLTAAKITNLHVHDLRRTLGSWQAAQGSSLKIIGESLGHSSIAATQIYARLDLDPVRQSVESATRAMLVAAKKKPKQLREANRA
jgi:integrase